MEKSLATLVREYSESIRLPVITQHSRTPMDPTGYIMRHEEAFDSPNIGMEYAITNGIKALAMLAAGYESQCGSKIAEDGFGAEPFTEMVRGLRAMLNFECGPRLDMGFCDAAILNIYRLAGFNEEEL